MYENNTVEAVLERMLSKIPDDMDKREGSVIYDALKPAAIEISKAYIGLDEVIKESFGDTAGREMLIRMAAERGIVPFPAVAAEYDCSVSGAVPVGARFTAGELYFFVSENLENNICRLKCETAGKAGNDISGKMIPVEYIEGLETISVIKRLIAGEDEEDTEHLRKRFLTSYETSSFGGNISDYRTKLHSLPNIGGCKIYPAWQGGGTVKIVICDNQFKSPSDEVVAETQEMIDPLSKTGQGAGLAPIGHKVTVCAAQPLVIDISTQLTFENGWSFPDIKEIAEQEIDAYFVELGGKWEESESLVVRISQIETRLLGIPHVIDARNTLLNGSDENITLERVYLPQRGEIYG